MFLVIFLFIAIENKRKDITHCNEIHFYGFIHTVQLLVVLYSTVLSVIYFFRYKYKVNRLKLFFVPFVCKLRFLLSELHNSLSHSFSTMWKWIWIIWFFAKLYFVIFDSRLGPCELPLSDQWLSHTHLSQISSLNHQSASTINLIGQQQQQNHQQQQTNQSQPKIMNVVASQVACPATAPKKIRRKSDNKVNRWRQRKIKWWKRTTEIILFPSTSIYSLNHK